MSLLSALSVLGFRHAGSPRSRSRGRTKTAIVLAILAFPVATLMLAKLFDSDVLGWIFGLTLMFGVAVLPFAVLFYLGVKLISRMRTRPEPSRATVHVVTSPFIVEVERGGVHASDDAASKRIVVPPGATLRAMLELAVADAYLPGISGGKATWVVESTGAGTISGPIAVCAQQWAEPAFLVPADMPAAAHFGRAAPGLNFRYRCQDDPDAVLAALMAASETTQPSPRAR